MTPPVPKSDVHQWANTILLAIVGFFVVQTYRTIEKDHDRIGVHDTEIALVKQGVKQTELDYSNLKGQVSQLLKMKCKTHELSVAD